MQRQSDDAVLAVLLVLLLATHGVHASGPLAVLNDAYGHSATQTYTPAEVVAWVKLETVPVQGHAVGSVPVQAAVGRIQGELEAERADLQARWVRAKRSAGGVCVWGL